MTATHLCHRRLLACAVRGLHLTPAEYWQMPFRDLLTVVHSFGHSADAPSRAQLLALAARFPDRNVKGTHAHGNQ